MMGSIGGPNIASGLVMYLDAANSKCFRGEPTTNIVTNTDLDTGWSKGYQTDIVFNEIDPPSGINSPVVGHTRGNSSGFWYSYGDYAPQETGTTYTVSLYVKTLDSNFTIASYTADNSEVGRVYSSHISVPNDGEWHRVVWNSFLNASNSESDSLSFNFTYNGAIGEYSTRTWFCAPQMEAKDHASKFVDGVRGTTPETGGGLLDLTKNKYNGTITSGVTFNSTNKGSVVFDGVSDYCNLGASESSLVQGKNEVSMGILFKLNTLSSLRGLIGTLNYNCGSNLGLVASTASLQFYNDTVSCYSITLGSYVETGKWIYAVGTYDGITTNLYAIKDDVLNQTSGVGKSGATNTFSSSLRVMGNQHPTNFTDGEMALSFVYNKVLTQEEVLQNYNATKARFGL